MAAIHVPCIALIQRVSFQGFFFFYFSFRYSQRDILMSLGWRYVNPFSYSALVTEECPTETDRQRDRHRETKKQMKKTKAWWPFFIVARRVKKKHTTNGGVWLRMRQNFTLSINKAQTKGCRCWLHVIATNAFPRPQDFPCIALPLIATQCKSLVFMHAGVKCIRQARSPYTWSSPCLRLTCGIRVPPRPVWCFGRGPS